MLPRTGQGSQWSGGANSEALLQGILVACKTKSNALTQESLQPLTCFPHVLLSEHKGQG